MAIGITRAVGSEFIPVWQGTDKDIQLVQGGFALIDPLIPVGTIIPAGTPMVFNETTRLASMLGTATLYATAGAVETNYQVNKGHTLKVGDNFATGAPGGKAYPITAIDSTTSALYDIVTVSTTIGAATAGDLMYASTATGATASAYPASNGLLYAETEAGKGQDVSIVIRGTVYARRVPYNVTIAAMFDDIIYSQSK